jgi:hypothetical protein
MASLLFPRPQNKDKRQQAKFIFYINSILDYLRISALPMMEVQIKAIISECVKRNRAGDSSYLPLRTSIVLNLQRCMGPTHWWLLANLHFKKRYEEFAILGKLRKMKALPRLSSAPTTAPSQSSIKNHSIPPPIPLLSQFEMFS